MFEVAIVCLVLTALLAYLNHRYVGLPTTIGVMSISLLLSFGLIGLDKLGLHALRDYEISLLSSVDFSRVLMQGMLSILLFAGALHVDLNDLTRYKWPVGLLSVCGTLVSTLLIGGALWYLLPVAGLTGLTGLTLFKIFATAGAFLARYTEISSMVLLSISI